MKIESIINASVMGKQSKLTESTGRTSFSLAIMQGGEAGSVSCTEDVYNLVKPFHSYNLIGVYDDKYNYMRVTGVVSGSEKSIIPGTK